MINDEVVNEKLVNTRENGPNSYGLSDTLSELSFYSERSHYQNGQLKLSCLSQVNQKYSVTSDEILIGDSSKGINITQQGQ